MKYSSNPSQNSHFNSLLFLVRSCRDAHADLWEAVKSWRSMNLKIVSEAASSVTQRWLSSLRREGRSKVCGLRNLPKALRRSLHLKSGACLVLSVWICSWSPVGEPRRAIRNCHLLKGGLLKTDPREGLNDAYLLNDRPRERKTEWAHYTDSIVAALSFDPKVDSIIMLLSLLKNYILSNLNILKFQTNP